MTNRTRRGFLLLVLAAGLTGCDGAHPSAPSAPSSLQPQQTAPPSLDTYSVSIGGVVYDTAHRLLHGARVEVIEGAVEGYWCHSPVRPTPVCIVPTVTNESGRFEFSGQFEGVTRLRASMDGYLPATLTIDSTTSSGATEFRLEPGNSAPTILHVTPSIGSTGGGAHITITGAGLLPSTRVAFGATNVAAWFDKFSGGIFVTTPSHAPGSVDVMVTNVDGQNAVAVGAYTFAAPESFDVNGNWRGISFAGEDDVPFTFTVVNSAVVSITCAMSGLVELSPPAPIIHGEFSFAAENIVAISGRILAPSEAMGVVTIGLVDSAGPCVGAEWHANKE